MKKFLFTLLFLILTSSIYCLFGCDEVANQTVYLTEQNETQDGENTNVSDEETDDDIAPAYGNVIEEPIIPETPTTTEINTVEEKNETPNENSNENLNENPSETQNEPKSEPDSPSVSELTPNTEDSDDEIKEEEHKHEYVPKITKQATCMEKGIITYTCECGDTYTEETPASGHDLVKHKGRASTCTKAGYGDYETCNNCDYSTKTELPLVEHNYQNGKCTMCGIYNILYEQNAVGYKVGKYQGFATKLEIADEVNGKPVTEISEKAFENCRDITEIVIGKNVNAIGKSAFANCGKLTEIIIPEGVITIEQNTFYMCVTLKEITLPKSLEYIDCYAFYLCRQLKTIHYNGSVEDWYVIVIDDDNLSGITVVCTDDTIEI